MPPVPRGPGRWALGAALFALACSRPRPSPDTSLVPATSSSAATPPSAAPSAAPAARAIASAGPLPAPDEPPPEAAEPSARARPPGPSPEELARGMTGTVACGKKGRCKAGKEVCVSAPREDDTPHCAIIQGWSAHRTPEPAGGTPHMAGLRGCDSSVNCPGGSICCLHMVGQADIQAITCHASLDECGGPPGWSIVPREICDHSSKAPGCRTPGTTCSEEGYCEAGVDLRKTPDPAGFEERWLKPR